MKIRLFIFGLALLAFLAGLAYRLWNRNEAPDVTALITDEMVERFLAADPIHYDKTGIQRTPTAIMTTFEPLPGLPLPAVDPLDVTDNIWMAASAKGAPIGRTIYKRFVQDGYRGTLNLEEIDSVTVFKRYCETGQADLVSTARPIQMAELQACHKLGRAPVALRVGYGALVLVVNAANSFVTNLSQEQLSPLVGARRWADVDPQWPNTEILHFLPHPTMGSFRIFVDLTLHQRSDILQNAPSSTFLEDETEVAFSIREQANGVGFMDYATYLAYADGLKLVTLGGIKPDYLTVNNGAYPLIYPIFIYIDPETLKTKPVVGAFLLFYLTHVNEAMEKAGGLPITPERLNRSKKLLLLAMGNKAYLQKVVSESAQTPTPADTPASTSTMTATATLTPTLAITATVVITGGVEGGK